MLLYMVSIFIKASQMSWIKGFIDFLLPPQCPICRKKVLENNTVCGVCFSKLTFISNTVCQKCGAPLPYEQAKLCVHCLEKMPAYDKALSVLKYDETSKALILPFKHTDFIEITPLLAKWMNQRGKDLISNCDCIVPVPLHFYRLLKRKYNQSALLAKELAKMNNKEYLPQCLKRCRYTKSQGHMNPKQRKKNVKNAFKITNPLSVRDRNILLIDDVMTTGATINECTKTLKKAGAKSVYVLSLARVIRD